MQIAKREFPRRLTQDDADDAAVFTLRLAEALLPIAKEQSPQALAPEILRRRRAFIGDVRHAEKHVLEIKRAGGGRFAAAVARLKAKDQYGEHPETGVLPAAS